jgi:thiol-disulfide isomerase/thioredoxin
MRRLHPEIWLLGGFGALIVIALVISTRSSTPTIQTAITPPLGSQTRNDSTSSSHPILAEAMPAFSGISRWWQTPNNAPLTPEGLKGKVVLIDFWTYSCINCIRTQPVLRSWWNAYEKDGLVIIGVHTPEFAFEREPENVAQAIQRAGLKFPIALDTDYAT